MQMIDAMYENADKVKARVAQLSFLKATEGLSKKEEEELLKLQAVLTQQNQVASAGF